MKMHGTVEGSAWLPSLLAMVVISLAVLIIFGATPSALLQIPQNAFNDMKATHAAEKTAAPASAPSPSAAATPGSDAAVPPHPPATPAAFDLAALANSPAEWPKAVILKEPLDFSGLSSHSHAPAGVEVKLVSISGNNLSVEFDGSTAIVPAEGTDLKDRVMAARARAGGN